MKWQFIGAIFISLPLLDKFKTWEVALIVVGVLFIAEGSRGAE